MTPLQVAFITGQSDPGSWGLSQSQAAFLAALGLPEETGHPLNFPYLPGSRPHRPAPLTAASVRNARMYFASRGRRFVKSYRPGVLALLDRAGHTLFLAGSCGLEILNNLSLPPERLARVSVFAYGPAARARPACRHLMVGGERDPLCRWFFPQVDCRVACGHMDYLESSEVLAACREFLQETRARLERGG